MDNIVSSDECREMLAFIHKPNCIRFWKANLAEGTKIKMYVSFELVITSPGIYIPPPSKFKHMPKDVCGKIFNNLNVKRKN